MDNRTHTVLGDERIGTLLFKLSVPAFWGMFTMALYNVVDTIFVGRYIGPLGIAGLSVVFPLQMLSMGIGQMAGMGGASLISRLIGAGNIARAERALGNAVSCVVGLSAVMMIGGSVNPEFWLSLMGSSETILPYARDYMTIILLGIVFPTSAMALNSLVRAEGNARVPMTAMIIGGVSNIVLDAVFIIGLDMGIKGAALATIIAQLSAVLYLVAYFFMGRSFLKFHLRNLSIEWSVLRGILSIGIASFARTLASSLSAVVVIRMCVAYGGDYAVSAFGIINRMMMFTLMPAVSIGQGLQPILGFNYGAKRYDRALKVIRMAAAAATAFSVLVFTALYFMPEPFIRIFTTDSELIALACHAAKRVFLCLYLIGPIMIGSLVFQSLGKPLRSFITSISRAALFLLPLACVLPNFLQLDGVWLAFPIADVLAFTLTVALLIPQLRMFRAAASPAAS